MCCKVKLKLKSVKIMMNGNKQKMLSNFKLVGIQNKERRLMRSLTLCVCVRAPHRC
jgi:hypothetical protein